MSEATEWKRAVMPALTIKAAKFKRALSAATLFASGDSTLPALNSVKIESDGNRLTLWATDRYVMCKLVMDDAMDAQVTSNPFAALLALDDMRVVTAVLDSTYKEGVVNITFNETTTRPTWTFDTHNHKVTFEARDAQFPGADRLLMEARKDERGELVDTVKHYADVALNPFLIDKINKAASRLNLFGTGGGMRWRFPTQPYKPILVESLRIVDGVKPETSVLTTMIMPIRSA